MTTPSTHELTAEFNRLKASGFLSQLAIVAVDHLLPLGLWLGVNSRETNCVNMLGDYQHGEYHGVGMCQIDIQHDIARKHRDAGTWKTPAGFKELQDYGAALLAANIERARKELDDLTEYNIYRVAADGYNENMGRAEADDAHGGDPDRRTTGHDYGKDVMARKAVFDRLLAGETT